MIKSENAEEEKQVKKDLDESKLNYAHALKRNMTLKAMLSMLNVSCVVLFELCNIMPVLLVNNVAKSGEDQVCNGERKGCTTSCGE